MDALAYLDVAVFCLFVISVISIGLWKSRGEESSEDYFLAGRGLSWWLIGFSLIAANISAEQFVGMSGQAARPDIGLAVASYEWIAAITLVAVAFFFLPKFLRSGIFTIPEYLEYRFNRGARTLMSLLMVIILVGVTFSTVTFLGAKTLQPLFATEAQMAASEDVDAPAAALSDQPATVLGIPITIASLSWLVGIVAAVYVAAGGLKACAWADLIQGSALIVGGAIIMVLAFRALDRPQDFEGIDAARVNESLGVDADAGFAERFEVLKERKMHMVLPASSTFLPWTALLLGIWIPNFYYWGLNQYIMQRTLGASSLAEGQKGVVFAAGLKLIIPFLVCIPGIIAFTLYAPRMQENAMTDAQLNRPVLADFESVRQSSATSRILFPFDADFAQLHPDLAQSVLAHNAQATGEPVPTGENLLEQNRLLIERATQGDGVFQVKQTLIGYDYDGAFPLLIKYLVPQGLRGFVLAALMGAVISSLASMLNAASTIFTMDLYREYIVRDASQKHLVWVGRTCVVASVLIGCSIAPQLAKPEFQGAFSFIQEFQGYISPGVLTIFLFGLFVSRSPRMCGVVGLFLSPVIYGYLHWFHSDLAFLNRMAITVGALAAILAVMTIVKPLKSPVELPVQSKIEMEESGTAKAWGIVVIIATLILYGIFF